MFCAINSLRGLVGRGVGPHRQRKGPLGKMMADTLDIGMGDYRVSPGAHICALYSASAERDALLRSYVRNGILSGDKCICVLDPAEATQMTQIVTSVGDDDDIDLQASTASQQLVLVGASDTTAPSGQFSAADKIGFWKIALAGIMNAAEYQCIRAIGEMSSSLQDVPGEQEVIRFESELNKLLPLYPQVIVCMYNLENVGGAFLVDLVSTHPKVFIKGMLVENPYFLTPEEWLERIGA
jgi:MEDS: MEthanogen/methylotroph, DcmR Sensory domain